MGKTFKKNKDYHTPKMKPYTKGNEAGKFTLDEGQVRSVTNKEVIRNANRSKKKGVRQQIKKQISNELNKLGYGK